HARGGAPDLLPLHAAAEGDVADRHDRRALGGGRVRGRGLAAFELDDVGLDAALGEKAELLSNIGRGVHHVRRRDRHPDIDLAHRRAALRRRVAAYGTANHRTGGGERNGTDPAKRHGVFLTLCYLPPESSSDAAVHGATYFSASRSNAVSVTPNRPSVTIGTNILSTW